MSIWSLSADELRLVLKHVSPLCSRLAFACTCKDMSIIDMLAVAPDELEWTVPNWLGGVQWCLRIERSVTTRRLNWIITMRQGDHLTVRLPPCDVCTVADAMWNRRNAYACALLKKEYESLSLIHI